MTTINKLTCLSVVALLGMWGCSSSQLASRSGTSYDDLYGSSSDVAVVARADANTRESRNTNPDYQAGNYDSRNQNGNADYYDESYLSSRNAQRRVSDGAGYNAGFQQGYYAGQSNSFGSNYMLNNYGSYYPMIGSAFGLGFQMGIGNSLRFGYSPFNRYGMGYNSWGYNPYGYSGFGSYGYDPFYSSMAYGYGGGYSPFGYGGYNSWGSPYGYGGLGGYGGFGGYNAFNPYYGGFGNSVFVVNNNYDNGRNTRSYGPRSNTARSNESYNSDFSNAARTSRNNGGREAYNSTYSVPSRGTSTSSDSYYARPRANSSGTYYNADGSAAGRTSSETSSRNARSSATSQTPYYSSPRSSSNSTYNSGNSSRSSRTYESSPSYNSSRGYGNSNSTYQAPARSTYEAPSRTYSAPTPTYNSGSSSRGSMSSSPSPAPSSSGSSTSRGPR